MTCKNDTNQWVRLLYHWNLSMFQIWSRYVFLYVYYAKVIWMQIVIGNRDVSTLDISMCSLCIRWQRKVHAIHDTFPSGWCDVVYGYLRWARLLRKLLLLFLNYLLSCPSGGTGPDSYWFSPRYSHGLVSLSLSLWCPRPDYIMIHLRRPIVVFVATLFTTGIQLIF